MNYSFAGEAALIQALRPSMVENGVYMHIQEVKDVTRENYNTAKGTAMVNTVIRAIVRFTHAPSATFIDTWAVGEGSDAGDKSANKAMTGLYKYALRQTFCIETGDDPDRHASEERAPKPQGLYERYDGLVAHAVALGVPDAETYQRTERMTDKELRDNGIELKAKVEAVEAAEKAGA